MSLPILIEAVNGKFSASLVGSSRVTVTESTKMQALASLKTMLAQRFQQGDLLFLELGEIVGVTGLAGKYANDPTLMDICDEAYQMRNAELADLEAEWALAEK